MLLPEQSLYTDTVETRFSAQYAAFDHQPEFGPWALGIAGSSQVGDIGEYSWLVAHSGQGSFGIRRDVDPYSIIQNREEVVESIDTVLADITEGERADARLRDTSGRLTLLGAFGAFKADVELEMPNTTLSLTCLPSPQLLLRNAEVILGSDTPDIAFTVYNGRMLALGRFPPGTVGRSVKSSSDRVQIPLAKTESFRHRFDITAAAIVLSTRPSDLTTILERARNLKKSKAHTADLAWQSINPVYGVRRAAYRLLSHKKPEAEWEEAAKEASKIEDRRKARQIAIIHAAEQLAA